MGAFCTAFLSPARVPVWGDPLKELADLDLDRGEAQLDANHCVALVTYAEKAGTVLEPTPSGCHGLTFSRDSPLLLSRLLTGPDRLGPALRAPMIRRSDHG